MDKERFRAELDVLRRKLPENAFRFMDMDTAKPYLVLAAKTSHGNVYTLRIELDEFPNNVPELYVKNKIMLKSGQSIPENDEFWNTLNHKDGMIGIRHYGQNIWTPMVSLYRVYLQGKMWLENYDCYLYGKWLMMDKERLKTEQEILKRNLPENKYRFVFMNTTKPYLVMTITTQYKNNYILRIDLDEFPQNDPKVYAKKGKNIDCNCDVLEPDLIDCLMSYKNNKVIIGSDEITDSWTPLHFKVLFQLYEKTEKSFIDIEKRIPLGKVDVFSWEGWSPYTSLFKVYVLLKWWIEQTEYNQFNK